MAIRERLPQLGFGAAQLGNLFHAISDDEAAAAVGAAWDLGVRYFDTAPFYGLGLSERRLGEALAGRPRNDYLISTKVGRLLEPSPKTADHRDETFDVPADHVFRWDFSRDGIRRSLEGSLDRLGLDHIDIVFLHDPDDHWHDASTSGIRALLELRAEGIVGSIGAGMNQSAMLAEFVRDGLVDVVMLAGRFTLLDQSARHDLLPAAREHGVAVVAAGVYNSGILSQPTVSDDARYHYTPTPAEVRDRARAIAAVCESFGVSLPAAALQFPLRDPAVSSVVVGLRTAQQVADTVARAAAPVPNELWGELERQGLVSTIDVSDRSGGGLDLTGEI